MKSVNKLIKDFKADDMLRMLYMVRAAEPYLKREGDYYKCHETKMVEMWMRINEAVKNIDYKKHRGKRPY